MEVVIAEVEQLGRLGADIVEHLVRQKPTAVLGLATGSSPLPLYAELIRRHQEEGLSFAWCRAFTLDEYVGLPIEHPERYRNVIAAEFTDHVDIPPASVQGPDGLGEDIPAACAGYEQAIAAAGGVDLQVLGIGADGHIAFNEPSSSLASRTRMKSLTEQTRIDNARFFGGDLDKVPMHALTQGIGTIMQARHVVLMAHGAAKAEAVEQLVEGPVSSRWPGTALQFHPHVTVLVDEEAASRLSLGGFYRDTLAHKPDWQRF